MIFIENMVNLMKSKRCLSLLVFVFIFDSNAYEIVHETITVTPGYEGGVLYSKTESGEISSVSKHLNSNAENNISMEARSEKKDSVSEKTVNRQF
jgi:hypothetical protein